jgi:hypothetical protein
MAPAPTPSRRERRKGSRKGAEATSADSARCSGPGAGSCTPCIYHKYLITSCDCHSYFQRGRRAACAPSGRGAVVCASVISCTLWCPAAVSVRMYTITIHAPLSDRSSRVLDSGHTPLRKPTACAASCCNESSGTTPRACSSKDLSCTIAPHYAAALCTGPPHSPHMHPCPAIPGPHNHRIMLRRSPARLLPPGNPPPCSRPDWVCAVQQCCSGRCLIHPSGAAGG